MPTELAVDRRGALKARHRQAIVDAARRLIDARQGPRFSVDELAAEADVSRRTVFNHFDSLDDVILAACTEILDAVVASFREAATASATRRRGLGTVFEEIVHAVRSTDLPQLTAYLWSALGGVEAPADPSAAVHAGRPVAGRRRPHRGGPAPQPLGRPARRRAARLVPAARGRGHRPALGRRVRRLRPSPAARRSWDDLLDRLVTRLRTGYSADR